MKRFLFIIFLLLTCSRSTVTAQSDQQTQAIVNRTLELLLHERGAMMDYQATIGGIYTIKAKMFYRGNKKQLVTKKHITWFDGEKYWVLDRRKNEVQIKQKKKENTGGMEDWFKMAKTNCTFTMKEQKDGYRVLVKNRDKAAKIKEATVLIDKNTFKPIWLKCRFFLINITVHINEFKTMNLSEDVFHFNPKDYPNAKVVNEK